MRALVLSVLLACSIDKPPPIGEIGVDELAAKLGEYTPVDANGEPTRKRLGVIPGAVLLSDSELFSTSELPADKARPLVFYCANEHCSASDEAARRARSAGYRNVKILPGGIAGWASAGKPVSRI